MHAACYDRYGSADVVRVVEIPVRAPVAGEVKLRVHAASLNPLDWKIRAGHLRLLPMFASPPRTVGVDLAGEVVAIGGGAGPRHVGERVFGSLPAFGRDGSCAQYVTIAARRLALIPAAASYEDAAALPVSAGSAVQALVDEAHVSEGQRVLVNGAAGGVGHFAVQIARHLGASVVATCSAANADFVRALGAEAVLDYARDDPASAGGFDVVFDVADKLGWARASPLLTPRGVYISTAGTATSAVGTVVASLVAPFRGKRARALMLRDGGDSVRRLADWLEQGFLRPHIGYRVGLDGVADALRRMEEGHGTGKTIVLPQQPDGRLASKA